MFISIYLTTNAGGDIRFFENVNFDGPIVNSVKNAQKCIHQFNIYSDVFELALITEDLWYESAHIQSNFFDKKKTL